MHAVSASQSQTSLPSYHYELQETEQRLAHHLRARDGRSSGNFVKNSRNGGVSLKLSGQDNGAVLPEYGRMAYVQGTVEILKGESIQTVEVKIEGALKLKEIAEGGTSASTLVLSVQTLWSKDRDSPSSACPSSLPFSLVLPDTFSDGKAEYPLPPTYEAHLSGVPGFRANIDYSVSAVVNRSKVSFFGLANTVVSTPFLYRPRSRPAHPLPAPLLTSVPNPRLIQSDKWTLFETTIKARSPRNDDITAMLYLPHPRVFSITTLIPFHLIFQSSPVSLAAFLPLTPIPAAAVPSASLQSTSTISPTRLQLLRQTSVDVRSITKKHPLLRGNNTDIWKTVQIGEAVFRHDNSDTDLRVARRDWMAWTGEVRIDESVRMASFKASGLTVKDYLVLCVTPPDPGKSAFSELRHVVPVRLVTDPWTGDFSGEEYGAYDYSDPALSDNGGEHGPNLEEQPALAY